MREAFRLTRVSWLAALAAALLLLLLAATSAAHAQATPLTLESISAGRDHACGITPRHELYCWGSNTAGQLGDPSITARCPETGDACSPKPVRVAGGLRYKFVSAGAGFTCALTTTGTAYCWGGNGYGELGIGSQASRSRPARVAIEGVNFATISAGSGHACALTTAGRAYCWGSNAAGRLGAGGTGGGHTAPVPVTGHLVFRGISAGYFHTCAVTRGGQAYCWGRNNQGEVGNAPRALAAAPARVAGGTAFRLVEAANQFDYSCGVDSGGALRCWGANCFRQLGVDSLTEQCGTPAMPCSTTPAAVNAPGTFESVGVAFSHSCALEASGALLCWGDNNQGQLGNGTIGTQNVPPGAVTGGATYRAFAVGRQFTCAITTDGVAQCWGLNDHGQLGDGTTESRGVPAPLAAP
jgi:alpha-tubulin suppressor-like RCC1 family protein